MDLHICEPEKQFHPKIQDQFFPKFCTIGISYRGIHIFPGEWRNDVMRRQGHFPQKKMCLQLQLDSL